jgi:hypothetical protein
VPRIAPLGAVTVQIETSGMPEPVTDSCVLPPANMREGLAVSATVAPLQGGGAGGTGTGAGGTGTGAGGTGTGAGGTGTGAGGTGAVAVRGGGRGVVVVVEVEVLEVVQNRPCFLLLNTCCNQRPSRYTCCSYTY